jgi:hypothetical protein
MNQHDILEFNMDTEGLYMGHETDVIYDYVNISWAQWMEGDSIIVNGTRLIQDGGYVQVAFGDGTPGGYASLTWTTVSEVFYSTDGWEDEYVNNITVTDDYLYVRFVFFSDAAFCYEGWYIDDFLLMVSKMSLENGNSGLIHTHMNKLWKENALITPSLNQYC